MGSRPAGNDIQEDDKEKVKLEVLTLVASSHFPKVMNRISSHGVASMQAQIAAKYCFR